MNFGLLKCLYSFKRDMILFMRIYARLHDWFVYQDNIIPSNIFIIHITI